MATIQFPGIDTYIKQLETIQREAPELCKMALYDGANVLAAAVQTEIDGLQLKSSRQKKGLKDGLGIARFWEDNGTVMTKIGFDGYNEIKTKRWPNGQPNAMLARSLIRGTSFLTPNRFAARAARKARAAAIEAMQKRFDAELIRKSNK